MKKSWHLNRRTFLRGSGIALSLPFMNVMTFGNEIKVLEKLPKRAAFIFFPNGASMPSETHQNYKDWYYFPEKQANGYRLRENHKFLKPIQDEVSFLSGLSNPENRKMRAHVGPTGFLTTKGIDLKSKNTISIDQEIVNKLNLGSKTPVKTLVMSTNGGVGKLARSQTLSFNESGDAIPALSKLSSIYESMYSITKPGALEKIQNRQNLLDTVLIDAKDMRKKLGKEDAHKLDEYLATVRQVEVNIERNKHFIKNWQNKFKDRPKINLDFKFTDFENYIKTIYDLIYISFKADITRTATYQISREDASPTNNISKFVGLSKGLHELSHSANKGEDGYKDWGLWDQFLSNQLARLISRLKSTKEGDGTLLDRTLIFHGSATGKTHHNYNYPIILAGGKRMGHKAGQFLSFDEEKVALADLYVHIGQAMGADIDKFGDSTGFRMSELFN